MPELKQDAPNRRQSQMTLTWIDGPVHGSAAIPLADFNRYLAAGDLIAQARSQ